MMMIDSSVNIRETLLHLGDDKGEEKVEDKIQAAPQRLQVSVSEVSQNDHLLQWSQLLSMWGCLLPYFVFDKASSENRSSANKCRRRLCDFKTMPTPKKNTSKD
jgi:hypothetical protein